MTLVAKCVILCCMKTVTIREAQHNLAGILRTVEAGETIQIVRRRRPVARLVPVLLPDDSEEPADWSGHDARMADVWKGAQVEELDSVLDELRGRR